MARAMLSRHDQINGLVSAANRLCESLVASGWRAPAADQFNRAAKAFWR
jgi:hypothetical protein